MRMNTDLLDCVDRLAECASAVGQVEGSAWSALGVEGLDEVLSRIECASRELHAAACVVAAERSRFEEARGRTVGTSATKIAESLGISRGEARGRIEAGKRAAEGSAAMADLAQGLVTRQQEKTIADRMAEVPEEIPSGVKAAVEAELVEAAREGMGSILLGRLAQKRLLELAPDRQRLLDHLQNMRRGGRRTAPEVDGTSLFSVTCTPEVRAMLDSFLAKFAGPGQCLVVPADPETGEVPSIEELAANDNRSPEQRVHDAFRYDLQLALDAGPRKPQGVASIVIRLTPEQVDAVFSGEGGGIVTTDAGSDLSAKQAVAMSVGRPWFVSALRDGVEELHRIDVDGNLSRRKRGRPNRNGPGRGDPAAAASGETRSGTTESGFHELPRARDGVSDDMVSDSEDGRAGVIPGGAGGPGRSGPDPRGPRLASAVQRLVLYAAHGGCTHPGCEVAAANCQAHHVHDYSKGGPTVVANLGLACPIHHGWVGSSGSSRSGIVDATGTVTPPRPDAWQTIADPAAPGRPRWIAPALVGGAS